MESESAIQGLRGELDFPWTITFPIQAGIIKLLPGITVAATPDSPASRANRTTLLPRSFNRTLHLSLRTLSSTWTSVASPQCHGGTVTTSVAPTGTVTEGIGDMSLRVMDGEPGGAEHGGEVEVVGADMEVVGTVRSARLDDGELREEPTAAAATSTTRTTMASQWRSVKATTIRLGGPPNEGSPDTGRTVANECLVRISLEDDFGPCHRDRLWPTSRY